MLVGGVRVGVWLSAFAVMRGIERNSESEEGE